MVVWHRLFIGCERGWLWGKVERFCVWLQPGFFEARVRCGLDYTNMFAYIRGLDGKNTKCQKKEQEDIALVSKW